MLSCTLPWTRSPATSASEAASIASHLNSTLVENERDDSAFHEPEYSNPASFEDYQNNEVVRRHIIHNEDQEDFIPDYEEVDPLQVQSLRRSLQKKEIYYLMKSPPPMTLPVAAAAAASNTVKAHKEAIDRSANNNSTKERIMQSLIYCIHKVILKIQMKFRTNLLILIYRRLDVLGLDLWTA